MIYKYSDFEIRIWDLKSNVLIKNINFQCYSNSSFSFTKIIDIIVLKQMKAIIKTDNKNLIILDLVTEKCLGFFEFEIGLCEIKVRSNNAISISNSHRICIYSLENFSLLNNVEIFDFENDEYLIRLEHCENGDIIFGKTNEIELWRINLENDNILQTYVGHTDLFQCLKILTLELFASGSIDSSIKIWNIINGNCLKTIVEHDNYIMDLELTDYGYFISCSYDSKIKVWNTDFACIKTLEGHFDGVENIKVYKENIISASETEIKMWDLNNGICIYSHQLERISLNNRCLQLSSIT